MDSKLLKVSLPKRSVQDKDVVSVKRVQVNILQISFFIVLQLCCIAVIWGGWSFTAILTAILLYVIRMFAITGFYHRYFAHKTFKTNRFWQFFLEV